MFNTEIGFYAKVGWREATLAGSANAARLNLIVFVNSLFEINFYAKAQGDATLAGSANAARLNSVI
jgi:hypothetical protein